MNPIRKLLVFFSLLQSSIKPSLDVILRPPLQGWNSERAASLYRSHADTVNVCAVYSSTNLTLDQARVICITTQLDTVLETARTSFPTWRFEKHGCKDMWFKVMKSRHSPFTWYLFSFDCIVFLNLCPDKSKALSFFLSLSLSLHTFIVGCICVLSVASSRAPRLLVLALHALAMGHGESNTHSQACRGVGCLHPMGVEFSSLTVYCT